MTDQERAMRFGYLLSEIEIGARKMLDGRAEDMMIELLAMKMNVIEAVAIGGEVSRESLDKITDWNVLPDLGLTRPDDG